MQSNNLPLSAFTNTFYQDNDDLDIDLDLDLDDTEQGTRRQSSGGSAPGKTASNDFISANPALPHSMPAHINALREISNLKRLKAYQVALDRSIAAHLYNLIDRLSNEGSTIAYRSTSLAPTQQTPEVIFGSVSVWGLAEPYTAPGDTEPTIHQGDLYVPCTWMVGQWLSDGCKTDPATQKKTVDGRPLPAVAIPLDNKGTRQWFESKHNKHEKIEDYIPHNQDLHNQGKIALVLCMPIGLTIAELDTFRNLTKEEKRRAGSPYLSLYNDNVDGGDYHKAVKNGTVQAEIARAALDRWIDRFNAPRLASAENVSWLKEYARSKFDGHAISIPKSGGAFPPLDEMDLEMLRELAEAAMPELENPLSDLRSDSTMIGAPTEESDDSDIEGEGFDF